MSTAYAVPLATALAVTVMCLAPVSAQALNEEPATKIEADGGALIDPNEIPSIHNTFYQVPDGVLGWDLLGEMDIEVEVLAPLRSQFHVDYSDEVKALDGQEVQVMGFIYPLKGGLTHEHFLLTAWPPSCPFCLPAGPSQMVEIYCETPLEFTDGAVLLSGKFEVLKDDPKGMYYRMQGAIEVDRFDDIRWTGQLPEGPQVPR